jgi:hypothetical protein
MQDMMRFLFNFMVLVLLAALVVGGVWHVRKQRFDEDQIIMTLDSVREIQRIVSVQAGMQSTQTNGRGWPVTIDPAWFDDIIPRNHIVSQDRPWLEVAPPEHADYLHPTVRMTIGDDVAGFWYNPGNGIIRARTPVTVSDRLATEMYNAINDTYLKSIFEDTTPATNTELVLNAIVQAEEPEEPQEPAEKSPHPNR